MMRRLLPPAAVAAALLLAGAAPAGARTHFHSGERCNPKKQRTYHRAGYRCVQVGDPAYVGDNFRLRRLPPAHHARRH